MERKCDEEKATEEEKEEKAAGAELKTKTPHNDVGKNIISTINQHLASLNSKQKTPACNSAFHPLGGRSRRGPQLSLP